MIRCNKFENLHLKVSTFDYMIIKDNYIIQTKTVCRTWIYWSSKAKRSRP